MLLFIQQHSVAVMVFVSLFLLASLFGFWEKSVRHWHVGYGVMLIFSEEDGTVWIASRLFDSPSHRHLIKNFSRLVSIDGVEIKFNTAEEFREWIKTLKPKRTDKVCWITFNKEYGEVKAIMKPELIFSKIPIYWDPKSKASPFNEENLKHATNVKYCTKTGEHYTGKPTVLGMFEAHAF